MDEYQEERPLTLRQLAMRLDDCTAASVRAAAVFDMVMDARTKAPGRPLSVSARGFFDPEHSDQLRWARIDMPIGASDEHLLEVVAAFTNAADVCDLTIEAADHPEAAGP